MRNSYPASPTSGELKCYILCLFQFYICFLDCTGRGENLILVLKPYVLQLSLSACILKIDTVEELYFLVITIVLMNLIKLAYLTYVNSYYNVCFIF